MQTPILISTVCVICIHIKTDCHTACILITLTLCMLVLPLIKEAQSQHGLRHGDYQRYRCVCFLTMLCTYIVSAHMIVTII